MGDEGSGISSSEVGVLKSGIVILEEERVVIIFDTEEYQILRLPFPCTAGRDVHCIMEFQSMQSISSFLDFSLC